MNFSNAQLQDLIHQAITAARTAGLIIAAHRRADIPVCYKESGTSVASRVVTEVDHKAQEAILEVLEPTCTQYDLALLTEESSDNGQRLQRPAFWYIDHMDGTVDLQIQVSI